MSWNIVDFFFEKCKYFFSILNHEIVYSVIIFIIIFGLAFLLRKRSPYWQYGLWSLVLLRLFLPADLHFSYSAYKLYTKINIDFNIRDVSIFAIFQDGKNGSEKESNSSPFSFMFAPKYRDTVEKFGVYKLASVHFSKILLFGQNVMPVPTFL